MPICLVSSYIDADHTSSVSSSMYHDVSIYVHEVLFNVMSFVKWMIQSVLEDIVR